VHEESGGQTAKQLGIPMPFNTVKPAIAALSLVIMFGGLLFIHLDHFAVAMAITISGASLFAVTLYAWLTSPLE